MAFEGAEALFLHDGGIIAEELHPGKILEAARSAGVRKVVALSSQGVRTRPASHSHGVLMRSVEDAVRQSGLEWTVLRPGGFHSNAYAWADAIRTRRTVLAPFGDVSMPTDEAHAQMLGFMPGWAVETTLAVLGEPTPDERLISPTVERILGRAPRTFADWAQENIAVFR